MVNKKGWLRIVEATITILIILGVIIVLSQKEQSKIEVPLSELVEKALEEAGKNMTLRTEILEENPEAEKHLNSTIKDILGERDFIIKICNLDEACSYAGEKGRDIYAAERIISSIPTEPELEAKKIRLFVLL